MISKVAAVTGGTGFVGGHLARALCERGVRVRILARPESRLDLLDDIQVEVVTGDLRKPETLGPFLDGADTLYHVAADYRLWAADPRDLYRSNVDGTKNILQAAEKAGTPRIVYTSTVGCLGIPSDGTPGDETTPVGIDEMIGDYKKSKFLAEQVAIDAAKRGVPIVLVNPSTPIGPIDAKPTPTGKIVVDFLNGKIPAFVDTGLNLIDVRDAAMGHILAAEKGRIGEKYILGNRNCSLREILGMIAEVSGKKAPNTRIPYAVAYLAGAVSTFWADRVSHRPPGIAIESVRMSHRKMYFSAKKAIEELGLPQSPVETAIADAVAWFTKAGYIHQGDAQK
jgi:dihydroflavonol-4-reductase